MSVIEVEFPGNLSQVNSAASLRALPSAFILDNAMYRVSDLGLYTYDASSLAADNGTTTLKPDDITPLQAGRWLLSGSGIFDSGLRTALALATGGTLVGFQQSGTGTTVMTERDKLRQVLNAADFLPLSYVVDGSVDYTTQLQAAITQAVASGRTLVFPAGIFKVTGTGLNVTLAPSQQLNIRGQGSLVTILRNTNGNVMRVAGQLMNVSDIGMIATSGHTVVQTNVFAQATWERVYLSQTSNAFSVWDNASHEYIDNRFMHCVLEATTASSVYAFNLVGALGTINDNVWKACRIQNSGTKHFFNIESASGTAQFSNCFEDLTFEVCNGGGIRLRAVDFLIKNCQNWDASAAIVNDFYDIDRNGSGTGCIGTIEDCGRFAGMMDTGKYDVALPSGGGGNGIRIVNCRTAGAGDPFKIDAKGNGIIVLGSMASLMSIANNTSVVGFDPVTQGVYIGGVKIAGARNTGWTAGTGTANKGAYTTYAGTTQGGTYNQTNVQAIDDATKANSQRIKAIEDALRTHGLIN